MNTCPKCGRQYSAPPAISRSDNITELCPVCGSREALEGFPGAEEALQEIERQEIAWGRVEPLTIPS